MLLHPHREDIDSVFKVKLDALCSRLETLNLRTTEQLAKHSNLPRWLRNFTYFEMLHGVFELQKSLYRLENYIFSFGLPENKVITLVLKEFMTVILFRGNCEEHYLDPDRGVHCRCDITKLIDYLNTYTNEEIVEKLISYGKTVVRKKGSV